MLKYKCKYTAEFFLCVLVVVGVHVVVVVIMMLADGLSFPSAA